MKNQMTTTEFLINKQRHELINHVAFEYLSILAILYGDQIDSGIRRVSSFGKMTMLEAENELRIRTMMLRGQRMRRKRELLKEHQDAETAMMERLKQTQ